MGKLDGKVAIVTGAASGLGKAMALRLSKEGAQVIAVGRSSNMENVSAEGNADIFPFQCDVSDQVQVAALHLECKRRYGRLDILCNNAGVVSPKKRIHETSIDDWDRVMAINVRGMFLVLRHSLQLMLESGGGSVVMMGSVASHRGVPGTSPYNCSKGAILSLTRTAALEYAQDNIRVNIICPGIARTRLLDAVGPDVMERMVADIPQGRLCDPEEVAALALFLASDEARHITGASYLIDGGRCAA